MKSKLFYLLLLIVCIFLFSISGRYTYAYFTDSKTIDTALSLHNPVTKVTPLNVNVKTLGQSQTQIVKLTNQTPLKSEIYLGTITNPWAEFIELSLPKTLLADEMNTQFSGNVQIKKIKELPKNISQQLTISVPIFIDTQLRIKLTTLQITVSNEIDSNADWPSSDAFTDNYSLTNTAYYIKNKTNGLSLVNRPTLFLKSKKSLSSEQQKTVDELFSHKVKTDSNLYFKTKTAYIPDKGFKIQLLDFESSTQDTTPTQIHVEWSDYNDYLVIPAEKNAIRQLVLSTDLQLDTVDLKKDTSIQTTVNNQVIAFASIVNKNSIAEANLSDIKSNLSWQIENINDFTLSSVNTNQLSLRQMDTKKSTSTNLKLIDLNTKEIYLDRVLISTALDSDLLTKFDTAIYRKIHSINKENIQSAEMRIDSNRIVYQAPYYQIPIYFKVDQPKKTDKSSSFSLSLDDEFATAPVTQARSADGNVLKFTLFLTPQQYNKTGFKFSLYRATSLEADSKFINNTYISLSDIKPTQKNSTRNLIPQTPTSKGVDLTSSDSDVTTENSTSKNEEITSQQTTQQTTSDSSSSEAKEPTVETSISDAIQ
ncbi:hypothetical protein [Enterococcus bulliens]